MRSPQVLFIVLAASLGACGQSLTPNKTGTGGIATGTGLTGPVGSGAGGSVSGAGGTGGGPDLLACNEIEDEYQQAVAAAQTCQVGASGQCQQLVGASLSACTCPTYVNDTSLLTMIENVWQTTGCASGVEPPCVAGCPAALNTVCMAVDGGSTGVCTWVPPSDGTGGTGGAVGSGGIGGAPDASASLCDSLVEDYAAALAAAKSCTPGVAGQCALLVPGTLSVCESCSTYVTDNSTLEAIQGKWESAGCGNAPVACPAIACISPTASMCVPSDAGGASCSN